MSENKVIGLYGAVPVHGEPISEVVEELERLLEEAKEGNITGFCYSLVGPAESISNGWAGKAGRHHMITGVSQLWFRILYVDYSTQDQEYNINPGA